ncbi:MAG: arginase family protein [Lactobacillus sp.]|nr:arginase family protein [Lactobacillus sp.]
MATDVIRLIDQDWQGGMNANYQIGAQIMAAIIPPSFSKNTKTIYVPSSDEAVSKNGIDSGQTLLTKMQAVYDMLLTENPQRVITVGGDCAVSEAPFDYLHSKYPNDLGIIWLDAHPDVSNDTNSHHVHEMVLANLLQEGAPDFNRLTKNPFRSQDVMLTGLQYKDLRPMDDTVNRLKLKYLTPQDLRENSDLLVSWLKSERIAHVAIHWDLDVLMPEDFHSILPAEPGLNIEDFGAAIGDLTLKQVFRILNDVADNTDLVGLTIAEHMPWDAIRLRNGFEKLAIFQ